MQYCFHTLLYPRQKTKGWLIKKGKNFVKASKVKCLGNLKFFVKVKGFLGIFKIISKIAELVPSSRRRLTRLSLWGEESSLPNTTAPGRGARGLEQEAGQTVHTEAGPGVLHPQGQEEHHDDHSWGFRGCGYLGLILSFCFSSFKVIGRKLMF